MNRSRNSDKLPSHHRQKGAVLVVGLIILLVLTLLGVQAMRSNVLQERMAGNMRERNLAFQAAEAALRVGEATINSTAVPSPGLVGDLAEWGGADATGAVTDFDQGVANPVFHVGEPLLVKTTSAGASPRRELFPVTVRGVGRQTTTVVILQSVFEPTD